MEELSKFYLNNVIYSGSNLEVDMKSIKTAAMELCSILEEIFKEYSPMIELNNGFHLMEGFHFEIERLFGKKGWRMNSDSGQSYYCKNGIAFLEPDELSLDSVVNWAVLTSTLLSELSIPVGIRIQLKPNEKGNQRFNELYQLDEVFYTYFELLEPLKISHTFAIVELSNIEHKLNIREVRQFSIDQLNSPLVKAEIEFPPELYEAGRGILSYFGTYLEEEYSDQKAKVTIEQDDANKTLRMTVESETGDKEVIEKAYEEYALIMSGHEPPARLKKNEQLVLKLSSELRYAKARIEDHLEARAMAEGRVDELIKQIGSKLNQSQAPVVINNHIESSSHSEATSKSSATAKAQQNLSLAIGGVAELKELMPAGSPEAQELEQLEQGLMAIKKEEDPEVVSTSPVMSKFRRTLEKIKSGEGKLAKTVKAAENGYEVFKDVATTYNKIADWCGLPHVPGILLST